MANISTCDPAGGRDYTSVANWEAATDNDLVTAAAGETLQCYYTTTQDGSACTLSGATVNASYFRKIECVSGQHTGVYDTGYRIKVTKAMTISEDYSQHIGMSYDCSGTGSTIWAVNVNNNANTLIDKCCIRQNSSDANSSGIRNCAGTIRRTINYCTGSTPSSTGFHVSSGNSATLENCTCVDYHTGYDNNGTMVAKNCVGFNNTTNDFSGSTWGASTNNASSDSTAPGTSPQTTIASTEFVDSANDDYDIASGSTQLKGNGADLSGSFTTDIEGQNYDTFDIGAFAFEGDAAGVAYSKATYNWGTVEACKSLQIFTQHTADAGNGTTVDYDILLDDVSQNSGHIDQTANGGALNLRHTLTDMSEGVIKLTIDNDGAGGLVIADNTRITGIPARDIVCGDFFYGETTSPAVSAHSLTYDAHSSAYTSSGATVETDGVKFAAEYDYFLKKTGVKDDVEVTVVFNPGSADNRLNIYLMADNRLDGNGEPLNCYKGTFRTGVNLLQFSRHDNGNNIVISDKVSSTIDNTATYKIKCKKTTSIEMGALVNTLTMEVNDVLRVTTTDQNRSRGGLCGCGQATYTNSNARVSKFFVQSSGTVDTTAPSTPTNFSATVRTHDRVDLACDNMGESVRYQWADDGVIIAETAAPSYKAEGLGASNTSTWTVRAVDQVYNESAYTSGLSRTTSSSADTTAPAAPTGLQITSYDLDVYPYRATLSWTAPADSDLEYYQVLINGDEEYENITSTTYEIYYYDVRDIFTVKAKDYSGNQSAASSQARLSSFYNQTFYWGTY